MTLIERVVNVAFCDVPAVSSRAVGKFLQIQMMAVAELKPTQSRWSNDEMRYGA